MKTINKKLLIITSIITALLILVIIATCGFDVRRIICLILSSLFLLMGYTKIKPQNKQTTDTPSPSETVWGIFSRIMGIAFVGEAIMLLISLFCPPVVSVIALAIILGLWIGLKFYGISLSGKK